MTEADSPLKQKEIILQRKWFNYLTPSKQDEIVRRAFEQEHSSKGKLDPVEIKKTREGLGL